MFCWGRNYLPMWTFFNIQSVIPVHVPKHFYIWTRKIYTISIHKSPFPFGAWTTGLSLHLYVPIPWSLVSEHCNLFLFPFWISSSPSLNKNITNIRIKTREEKYINHFYQKEKDKCIDHLGRDDMCKKDEKVINIDNTWPI